MRALSNRSKSWIVGLAAVALMTAGVHFLAEFGRKAVLTAHAHASARQWVSHIEDSVTSLAGIAMGEPPDAMSRMFLENSLDVSPVMSYSVFDRAGNLRIEGGVPSGFFANGEHRMADLARTAEEGVPHLDMVTGSPGHHDEPSAHSGHGHAEHAHATDGWVFPFSRLFAGGDTITSYYHPVRDGDAVVGVLVIDLNQKSIAGAFSEVFNQLLAGMGLLMVLCTLPPALYARKKARASDDAERAVHKLAFFDPLTHLPNRRHGLEKLDQALVHARRTGQDFTLFSIDVDGFKPLNDLHGHDVGDNVLRQIALRLCENLESGDLLARMGGDIFLFLPADHLEPQAALARAHQFVEAASKPIESAEHMIDCSIRIGIVEADGSWPDRDSILRAADVALDEAKSRGAGTVIRFDTGMNERIRIRNEAEADLRQAIRDGEFVVHYQPQFRASDRRLQGFEALVRWRHATRGILQPDSFILLAEKMGLIGNLSRLVMVQACRDAALWPNDLHVAVNVSAIEFHDETVVDTVRHALEHSGLDPHRLEIEITESVLMCETEHISRQLDALHQIGVSIALDDFGTGYSSLAYLNRYPFDKLKIDKSFLLDNSKPEQSRRIVESIISLGRTLDLRVIAEGVETEEQLNMLVRLGCDQAQGFLLGRPLPLSASMMLAEERNLRRASDHVIPTMAN